MPKIIDDAQIFQSVMEAVVEYGYEGATTKRLAKHAGIGEVTLFRKYGSKSQLVKQAMLAVADQANFESTIQYTGDIQADFVCLLEEIQKAVVANGRFFFALFIEVSRHHELQDALTLFQARFRVASMLVIRYQAEGILKQEHPLHLIANLVGPLLAMNMFSFVASDISIPPLDLQKHVSHFIENYRSTWSET